MREIKFRGMDEKGIWHYGSLMLVGKNQDKPCILETLDNGYIRYKVIPETVGQFTGLYDKNNVEIYKDDIVSLTDPYNNCTAREGAKVVFSYEYVGGWVITANGKDFLNMGTRTKYLKVIGNIHENPELLEQAENE